MGNGSRSTQAASGGAGAVYGLGFIGAIVYYWQHADGLWWHLWSIVEAIFWPAFLVYDLLSHLGS
ncbi:MAG: hypothetical protein M0Z98_11830 [Actinomycetales bacterium]|nr:hypothetical protein [Actinomycetales bacterium]